MTDIEIKPIDLTLSPELEAYIKLIEAAKEDLGIPSSKISEAIDSTKNENK